MSESDSRSKGVRRGAVLAVSLVSLSIGLVIGWGYGRASAPLFALPVSDCAECGAATSPDESGGSSAALSSQLLADSMLTSLSLASRLASLQALLEELSEQGVTPSQAARGLIQGMSEEDLRTALDLLTPLSDEALAEVDDVRAFALRLCEIAIEGTFEEGGGGDGWAEGAVLFTAERDVHDPEPISATIFTADTEWIYAAVQVDEDTIDDVLMKWSRTDKPEILRLNRRRLESSSPYSAFGLRKDGGFPPGEYRVTFYTADEAMSPLATGRYRVEVE
jgi:hypothetical protein